jgi:hypothetical protein
MFFAMVYGPLVISLLLAGLAAGATWRAALSVPISVRIITGAAMVLALGTVIARWIWSFSPFWIPDFSGPDADLLLTLTSLLLPLMVGTIAVILQMLPPPQSGPRGTAALTPRNLLTYAPRGWLWILGSLLALVMLVSVLAGLLSTTDDWGRHVMYEVLASNTTSAGTRIYGWWFSMRCLVALAALVATLLAGLAVLARPAVGIDAATGAVLLHFHAVLGSLAGTSSLTLGFDSGATGWVSLGSSFAALGPVLQVASWIALTAGLTTWWYVLFSIAPVRSRRRAESTAS